MATQSRGNKRDAAVNTGGRGDTLSQINLRSTGRKKKQGRGRGEEQGERVGDRQDSHVCAGNEAAISKRGKLTIPPRAVSARH